MSVISDALRSLGFPSQSLQKAKKDDTDDRMKEEGYDDDVNVDEDEEKEISNKKEMKKNPKKDQVEDGMMKSKEEVVDIPIEFKNLVEANGVELKKAFSNISQEHNRASVEILTEKMDSFKKAVIESQEKVAKEQNEHVEELQSQVNKLSRRLRSMEEEPIRKSYSNEDNYKDVGYERFEKGGTELDYSNNTAMTLESLRKADTEGKVNEVIARMEASGFCSAGDKKKIKDELGIELV